MAGGGVLPALVPPDPRACEEPLTQASGCDLGGQPRGRGTALLQGGASAGQGHRAGPGNVGGQSAEGDAGTAGASPGSSVENESDNPTSGFFGFKHFL